MRRIGILLAFGLLAGPVAAQPYQDPPREWTTGYGQGILEAAIRNGAGASFALSCARDARGPENPPTGAEFTLTLPRAGQAGEADGLEGVITVDARSFEMRFDRRVIGRESFYTARAFNPRAGQHFAEIISALRRGRRLSVYVPPDRLRQTFSLAGASRALRGLPPPASC